MCVCVRMGRNGGERTEKKTKGYVSLSLVGTCNHCHDNTDLMAPTTVIITIPSMRPAWCVCVCACMNNSTSRL